MPNEIASRRPADAPSVSTPDSRPFQSNLAAGVLRSSNAPSLCQRGESQHADRVSPLGASQSAYRPAAVCCPRLPALRRATIVPAAGIAAGRRSATAYPVPSGAAFRHVRRSTAATGGFVQLRTAFWPGRQPRRVKRTSGCLVLSWLLLGRAVLARTVHGLDAGEDEIDAGEELLAVVVFAQLRPGFVHGWVFSGVELRPLCGDGGEKS
jgi:hypothetical protein